MAHDWARAKNVGDKHGIRLLATRELHTAALLLERMDAQHERASGGVVRDVA